MIIPKYTKKEIAHLQEAVHEKILGSWSCNADLDKEVKIFTAGEGCWLYDIHGRKILDTFSSLITTAVGHGRIEIGEAMLEQMKSLEFFPIYHDGFTVPQIKLAEKLAEIAPGDLEVTCFVNSGSEANEFAIKMARQYFWQTGQPNRTKVIARRGSYHGTTIGTTAVTGFATLRTVSTPVPGCLFAPQVKCSQCEFGLKYPSCKLCCLKGLEKLIQSEGPDTIAAIIMDPLPGSDSGYPLAPKEYIQGVRRLCDKYGILLIFDEVQTGFGKTGYWFACEYYGVVPDFLVASKAITSGYQPLGAVITKKRIADVFKQGPGSEFRSGSTYGGHTLACVAALKNLEIFEREHLVEHARDLGKYITKRFKELKKYSIVDTISGLGTLWAIELKSDKPIGIRIHDCCGEIPESARRCAECAGSIGAWIRNWCWENGMILRNNGNMLVIAPALVMTYEKFDMVMDFLHQGIQAAMKHFKIK